MSHFSVREILLVLAVVVVSINWAWDHWSQVQLREEWCRRVATEQSHNEKLQSSGVHGEHQGH
jgi:hypothetical protein